ncbi:RepB family plasmid replication initiator protein [bacterium M00.F.Ca.ET.230.01.1.1]|nr:RepB family plasmid replication initiator protein [bacterium M00.F.Ca.ET.230.01.1.1]
MIDDTLLEMTPERIKKMQKTMQMYDLVYGTAEPARQEFFLKAVETMLAIEEENAQKVAEQDSKKNKTSHIATQDYAVTVSEQQQVTKIYGEQWIVIQNRLLNAISHLEMNERRLIMLLSPIVRKEIDKDPKQRVFKAYVVDFIKQYNIRSKKYYGEFAKIADSILQKVYYFWEDYKNTKVKVGANWVSECHYLENEGALEIRLDDRMIEMLTLFDKNNPFTKYQRDMIVNLGSYGIVLFEMIASCMHQQYKQKAYTIEYLREKFNCVDIYPKTNDFKNRVIDKAISDIEKYTPYRIKYEQKKKGRIVSEIVFSFEDINEQTLENKKKKGENERDPNTIDWVNGHTDNEAQQTKVPSWQTKGLSDAQIKKIGVYTKEFIDANSSKIAPNDRRDYPEIFEEWKRQLKDPKSVKSFHKVQELLERTRNV